MWLAVNPVLNKSYVMYWNGVLHIVYKNRVDTTLAYSQTEIDNYLYNKSWSVIIPEKWATDSLAKYQKTFAKNKIPECPAEGVTAQVKVSRVIDGDTIEVEIVRRFNVRLLNYSSPELKTPEGELAKAELAERLKPGDNVHIFIPAFKAERLVDNTTFNRVLAYVYNQNKEPV